MIRKGYVYYASNIKEHTTERGTFYTFSIRDDIENGTEGNKYQYYNCITYSPVVMQEGVKVVIDDIRQISSKQYNGKVYQNMSVEVTVKVDNIP